MAWFLSATFFCLVAVFILSLFAGGLVLGRVLARRRSAAARHAAARTSLTAAVAKSTDRPGDAAVALPGARLVAQSVTAARPVTEPAHELVSVGASASADPLPSGARGSVAVRGSNAAGPAVAQQRDAEPQLEPSATAERKADPEPELTAEPELVVVAERTPEAQPEPTSDPGLEQDSGPVATGPLSGAAPEASTADRITQPEPELEPTVEPVATPAPADDLARLEGVGPKIAAALTGAGIRTFRELADTDVDALRATLKAAGVRFVPSLPTWPQQARLLADGDETGFAEITRKPVAGRRPALVSASASDASNDLKRIEGIGPKMAGALAAAGITTYAQLAKMDEAGIRRTVSAAGLRFAPSMGTWARQAKLLAGDEAGIPGSGSGERGRVSSG